MIDLTPDPNHFWFVPELQLLFWLPEEVIWQLVRSGELPSVERYGYTMVRDTDAVAYQRELQRRVFQ